MEKPGTGSTEFAPGFDIPSSCLNCHDYKENHHPTDIAPDNPANYPFPLSYGKITCSTCHNPHQEGVFQRGPAAKGADVKGKLRLANLCFACHEM